MFAQPVPFYFDHTYRQQFLRLRLDTTKESIPWPVNGSPKHLELKSLLQPYITNEEKTAHLHPNEIHREFLLSFLDMVEWWAQNAGHRLRYDEGVRMSTANARLCGLLHVCFLIWDSGLLDVTTAQRLNCQLREEKKRDNSSTAAQAHISGVLLRALLFSQIDLKNNAKDFACRCMLWNQQIQGSHS